MEITFPLAHAILALPAGVLFLFRRRFALVVVPSVVGSLLAGMWIKGHAYHLSTAAGIAHFLDDIVGALNRMGVKIDYISSRPIGRRKPAECQ